MDRAEQSESALLRLPLEIRHGIYEFGMESDAHINVAVLLAWGPSKGLRYPDFGILSTGHQTHDEAEPIIYRNVSLYKVHLEGYDFMKELCQCHSPTARQSITRLSILHYDGIYGCNAKHCEVETLPSEQFTGIKSLRVETFDDLVLQNDFEQPDGFKSLAKYENLRELQLNI